MDSAKKSPDLPTLTPVQLMEATLAEKTYSAPKTFRLPRLSHFRSTPTLVDPASQFQVHGTHRIKKSMHQDVIGQVLSEKVCLSVKEILALSPEVRRPFQKKPQPWKATSFSNRAHSKAAHHVTTFSMDKHHKHFSAEPALPLWTIEVTLDHTVTAQHHWQWLPGHHYLQRHMGKTGMPMKHEQVNVHGVG